MRPVLYVRTRMPKASYLMLSLVGFVVVRSPRILEPQLDPSTAQCSSGSAQALYEQAYSTVPAQVSSQHLSRPHLSSDAP